MFKKCILLWREIYLEVKILKILRIWIIFGGLDVVSLVLFYYIRLHYTI